MEQNNASNYTAAVVREMTDADCKEYGIERDDFAASDILWLAVWPDRSGYYTEDNRAECDTFYRFCVTVCNESECFENAEDAQEWLHSRLN